MSGQGKRSCWTFHDTGTTTTKWSTMSSWGWCTTQCSTTKQNKKLPSRKYVSRSLLPTKTPRARPPARQKLSGGNRSHPYGDRRLPPSPWCKEKEVGVPGQLDQGRVEAKETFLGPKDPSGGAFLQEGYKTKSKQAQSAWARLGCFLK